jgi:hypothetical protein
MEWASVARTVLALVRDPVAGCCRPQARRIVSTNSASSNGLCTTSVVRNE